MNLKQSWQSISGGPGAARAASRRMRYLALFLGILTGLGFLWQSNAFWDALSPITHKKELYRLAGETKVDPLMLAAIVREESSFFPYARSRKGAMGLMQILPATAEELARELKIDYQDPEDLYREDINLRLGAHYFARLIKGANGNLVMALASYNAGPSKVKSWGLEPWGLEQEALIDSIPVAETRHYVRGVLRSYRQLKFIQDVKRMLRGDEPL